MNWRPIIAFFLLPASLSGQGREIDSLKRVLPSLQDTARIDCLNSLAFQYISAEKKDSAEHYAAWAYPVSKKLNYIHGMAEYFFCKAEIVKHFEDDFPKAEALAKESLRWYERTNNKEGIWDLYTALAFYVFSESKYDEAERYGMLIYEHSKTIRDTVGMIDALTGANVIHYQKGNFDTAFYFVQEAQQLAISSRNKLEQAGVLFNYGVLYRAIGDYPTALTYYRRAFEMDDPEIIKYRVANDWDIWVRMEHAELFSLLLQYDSAWHYYHLTDSAGIPPQYKRIFQVSVGETHFLQKNYRQALENFLLGLADHKRLNDVNEIKRTLLDIAKTYYELNDNASALKYAREGLALSLQTYTRKYAGDAYKIFYSVYDRLHRRDSAYFYYLKYIGIRDAVLSDQTKGKFAAYTYEQKIDNLNREKLISQQQLSLQQQQLKSESLLRKLLIGGMIFVLLLGFIIFRNIVLQRRNDKLRNDTTQAELKQQGAELEMQALRAQMNPHFIFNCLNSINRFILKNETEPASDYLTKFSRLIRMVLVNSKNKLITLEDELEMLRLYLDMERLRFKDRFDYKISFLNSVDLGSIQIPPLLLQPFAENAIWHGLMNKEDNGRLEISFRLDQDMLICTITDNGVGREAAALLKSKSAMKEKSMGLRITKERLSLINKAAKDDATFEFVDLFDAGGNAAGTKVILRMSTKEMNYI
ncbi:MAG TPA: histidine kinase [Puia sp.]|nr:histidine kinase [Puia sp.]